MNRYNSIRPSQEWLDTDGNRIQAHAGTVIYHDGRFYWYGENKEKSQCEFDIWHWGVRMYSSNDLYNWQSEGIVCPPVLDDLDSPLHPQQKMDRPHIVYNEATQTFVLWMKVMVWADGSDYLAVATSDKITGPYVLSHKVRPAGFVTGDFDLVKDPDTSKAYLIFEKVHTSLIIMELTEDYQNVKEEAGYTEHMIYGRPPLTREAPALFRRNGQWYMFTSATTAKFPNPTECFTSCCIHGPWTNLGRSHVNDVKETSFDSQISGVFKHPYKKDLYIALADRWLNDLPEDLPNMVEVFDSWFDPTREPLADPSIQLTITKRNTSLADYVWLPVTFDPDGTPKIYWQPEWRIDDYE